MTSHTVTDTLAALPCPRVSAPALDASLSPERLTAFLSRRYGQDLRHLRFAVQPLRGGLEATAIASVRASYTDGQGRSSQTQFVAKRLDGLEAREATVYQALAEEPVRTWVPRLLECERVGGGTCYLYMEQVTPWRRWPWTDLTYATMVLEQLAVLHTTTPSAAFAACSAAWDYETVLAESAQKTLDKLAVVAAQGDGPAGIGSTRRPLERIVTALPAIRRALREATPFGVAPIHGDIHSGNVIIRAQGATQQPVFLDWSRARMGSPLEDVSSWLHSLGYWVPAARQHHDALLRRYLAARGLPAHLSREARTALWLAETSNVLGGALRYHLSVLAGWGTPSLAARRQAGRAAGECLRVIRRTDALWRS